MAKDLYSILGVQKNASEEEIKKAYRRLAKKLHPDFNPGDKASEAKFKEVNTAYEVLSDEKKRKQYDQFGDASFRQGFDPSAAQAGWGGAGFDPRNVRFDFGGGRGAGFEGFGDIFNDLFGRGGVEHETSSADGEDAEYEVEISFDEAVHGSTRMIQFQRDGSCTACNGTGARDGSMRMCPSCRGTGRRKGGGIFNIQRECPDCGGTGRVPGATCSECRGRGRILRDEKLSVKIPAGVSNGSKIRIAGKGGPGRNGGAEGDLYIITKVREHPYFTREGDDISVEVPVTLAEALLGAKIEVPTIDGTTTMTIPAGTQNGQKFRLSGKGARRLKGGGSGDQYVIAHVELPRKIDEASKKLIMEFDRINGENPRRGRFR